MSTTIQAPFEGREPQPKPRLGDYYAGLSEAEWDSILALVCSRPGYDAETYELATHLFDPEWFASFAKEQLRWELELHLVARASDAFAFGATKYGIGNWRNLSSDEHLQGAGRHFKAWLNDPQSKDDESGLLHEAHFLARAIMCLKLRRVGK